MFIFYNLTSCTVMTFDIIFVTKLLCMTLRTTYFSTCNLFPGFGVGFVLCYYFSSMEFGC